MNNKYIPSEIEPKWQKIWDEQKIYHTTGNPKIQKKKYILDMFPYPSGSGLHVGHPLGYIATDIYCRYLRMNGYDVLHPMGWDAFGLPAENYAIKSGVDPKTSTNKNIETFKRQIKMLGLSYDWDREINTSSPEYYKWTQWLFIKLYEKGLAYRKKAPVNWCDSCRTVLANEQVINGKCERCTNNVIQKELEQWFFKITEYVDELLTDLDKLDWNESIKTAQKNWIGKSEGAEIEFRIKNEELRINVFTTRPDTLFGTTYLVIAPESDLVKSLKSKVKNWDEVQSYIDQTEKKTELQRTDLNKEKTGIELKGIKAINPANNKKIPIWIADYVLVSYGTGAIMAVPAHDERDWEFAVKFNLPIKFVVNNSKLRINNYNSKIKNEKPYIDFGYLINADKYSGMTSEEGGKKIVDDLKKKDLAEFKVQYKLRDWLISRQRYWGAPIPIIYCRKCLENYELGIKNYEGQVTEINEIKYAIIPVLEKNLPVELPIDVDFAPTGESPLVKSKTFHDVKCPKCQSPARRESDTMDTFVDSSWYYLRYIDPSNNKEFAKKELINKWMPIDTYVGGSEHAVLHLLYARFITKALNKMGYVNFDEPFIQLKNQGLILAEDGRKMSKSLGNVINPDEIVERFGADAFRLYEMFMGPLEDAKPWSTSSIMGVYRFLEKVWKIGNSKLDCSLDDELHRALNKLSSKVSSDIRSFRFNTAIAAFMTFINDVSKKGISKNQWQGFLILLSPFAPHICEELWNKSGKTKSITKEKWVNLSELVSSSEMMKIDVQINNKFRGSVSIIKENESEQNVIVLIKKDENLSKLINNNYKIIKYITGKKIIIMVK